MSTGQRIPKLPSKDQPCKGHLLSLGIDENERSLKSEYIAHLKADDLATMLGRAADIVKRGEKLTNHFSFLLVNAISADGISKCSPGREVKQPCISSLDNGSKEGCDDIEASWHLSLAQANLDTLAQALAIPQKQDGKEASNDSSETNCELGKDNEDLTRVFDNEPEDEADDISTEQKPFTTIEDFINIFDVHSGRNQGANKTSDALSKSEATRAAKRKGDLNTFTTRVDKVLKELKQLSDKTVLPEADQLIQEIQAIQGRLLLQSLRQFIEYLRDNGYDLKNHYRMVWVMDNYDKFSSVAQFVRMLLFCDVIVERKGGHYGKRKSM